ncbi:MAG: YggT family protein [Betaproteobacteria bacterium]|jgi:YggT family protein|nr:YggT family protein [Betaproteobacteria bacterium]
MLADALHYLLNVAFGIFVYALLLRFYMQLFRAPFRNPLGQMVAALTDWLVKPVRRVLPGWGGVDWSTLLLAWLLQFAWHLAVFALRGTPARLAEYSLTLFFLAGVSLVKVSLYLLMGTVFVQVILSWVSPYNPLSGILNALTTPFLRPVRRVLPPLGGQIDLSPLVLFVLCNLLLMLPIAWLEQALVQRALVPL